MSNWDDMGLDELRTELDKQFEYGSMRTGQVRELKARIKALEGVIKEWFTTYPCSDEPELYYENTDCEYCSVVNKMYRVLSNLEEV